MTPNKDESLIGWRFVLFNAVLAGGNIIAISNIPGYTFLASYAAGDHQGVTLSFGAWATTDHIMGIVLRLPFARWLSGRYEDHEIYVGALALVQIMETAMHVGFVIALRSGSEHGAPDFRRGFSRGYNFAECELTFPDALHEFDARDGDRGVSEVLEPEHRAQTQLDGAVILFNEVVRYFLRRISMSASCSAL